jgi:hypothetical protein
MIKSSNKHTKKGQAAAWTRYTNKNKFNFVNNCMFKSEIMMSLLTRNLSLPVMYVKDNF